MTTISALVASIDAQDTFPLSNFIFYQPVVLHLFKISIKVPMLSSKRSDILFPTKEEESFYEGENMKLVKFALYLAILVSNFIVNLVLICVMQIG